MSDRLKELREKRARIVTQMREITDKAQKEKRDMIPEELQQHDKLFNEQDALGKNIQAEERQAELEREQAEHDAQRQQLQQRQQRNGSSDAAAVEKRAQLFSSLGIELPRGWTDERDQSAMKAFRGYLRNGTILGDGSAELRALQEMRAGLQAGDDLAGGFTVAPMQFVAQLIQNVDNQVFVRQKATKFRVTSAASMGAPSLDGDVDDADWTSEIKTGSDDTGLKFGRRELYPRPLAKRVKVSKRLLRISALPVDQIVMQRLAYKFGVTQEKAYMTGDGANKPLGVFTASPDGIPTSRDVSTGNTTTAPTFDGLMEAKYSVKGQYWSRGEWLFHRDALKLLAKVKDSTGNYIWQQSVQAGQPDKILNSPISMSEYVPNTFTTGLYVGIFGDFSNYWIADALDMQVQRLTELYAETNQDGFIGRLESDGMPVLAEAFARVKLA